MNNEQIKNVLNDYLTQSGATEVIFEETENSVAALFNSREVISFKTNIPGWTHSGIQVDNTGKREYKIELRRV